jgi:hypothetical protein
MDFKSAMEALNKGEKVKLPEWQGYWFKENNQIKVHTRTGDVIDTPYINDYQNRVDWEITDGSRDFGGAVTALKAGKKVARKGWNGKGMFLLYIDPFHNNQYRIIELEGLVGTLTAYIAMKTADNKLVPWLASQTDVLAEDWIIVE